ncbi:Putative serine/threonine-protein kinase/receptor [Fagus crenata]
MQSPAENSNSPSNQGKHNSTQTQSRRCCRGLKDCMIMGSIFSTNQPHQRHHHQPISNLVQQVADLEREIQSQKEHRLMYKKMMERTQDYLRYCLQIAQENGFLHLIINNKDDQQQAPTPVHQHSDLAAITNQAKLNGWYIDPHEIELQEKLGHGSSADIYKGTWHGFDVAVKCLNPDYFQSNGNNGVSFFAQELDTLSRERHPFVLHLMGACLEPPKHGWVVTELLGMTLKEWLHGPVRGGKRGWFRFLQLKRGWLGNTYLHAPEVIKCEPYDEKCDVYSFGIILNEIITREYPYIETDYSPTKIAMEVAEGKLRPTLPKDDGQLEGLIEFICLSWDANAYNRPSFNTITCNLRAIQNSMLEIV